MNYLPSPSVAVSSKKEEVPRIPLRDTIFICLGVFVPPIGVVIGMIQVWGWGVDLFYLALAATFYVVTGFGVTVGYHRLFVHQSFQTKPWLKVFLGVAGSMALEGPLFNWCTDHGSHHEHSDDPGDRHSPHHSGGLLKGFLHAHVGWLFTTAPPGDEMKRLYIPHLMRDKQLVFIDRHFTLWAFLSLALPTFFGWLYEPSLQGAFLGFLWGGLIRICALHHVTWCTNSVCHLWGDRKYETGDFSTDTKSLILKLLSFGEAGHNTHHAFDYSAAHDLDRPYLDLSFLFIKLLETLGAASRPILPKAATVAKKRLR